MVLVWISAVSHCKRLLEDNPGPKGLIVQTHKAEKQQRKEVLSPSYRRGTEAQRL